MNIAVDDRTWDKEWMMTFTGRQVLPLALNPEDVDIRDIAHATAMQCRYNGHVTKFYSVAEHMVHISDAVLRYTNSPVAALQGLVHDGNEAYTGDMIRPVKNSLKAAYANWKEVEDSNERAIAAALNLPYPFDPMIKECDKRIIVNEKTHLFGPNKPWDWDFEPLDIEIRGWLPHTAEGMYLSQFGRLTGDWTAWGEWALRKCG
jgi:hypothetical protein